MDNTTYEYDNLNLNYSYIQDPLSETFDAYDTDPVLLALSEASYADRAKRETLKMEVLDIDKYVRVNELQPISNPSLFSGMGVPTSDGLLSQEIFGITQKERSGTFAYIDLHEYFLDPSCYKALLRLDSKFNYIIKALKKYKIDADGSLVEDEGGGTGLRWLKANFNKIKFKKTDSRSRDMRIRYIQHNNSLGRMWINKYIVIPPFYRDVNSAKRSTGVGQINTFYINLITAARAIQENNDYGMSLADATCAKVQDTIRAIYDWFCGNSNDSIQDPGTGLSGKTGIIRANMAYTADYSSRLVICAPELKKETIDDLMVDIDRSAMPLAAVVADFYPFVIFHMRQFFENQLLNINHIEAAYPDGSVVDAEVQNPMIAFSDDVLKEQLKNFVYSHDNRFLPVEIPTVQPIPKNRPIAMVFKYKRWQKENAPEIDEPVFTRPLTWTDVIYMAAVKSVEGKTVSITRFPYDSYFNTIYTKVEVASTSETEQLIVNGEYYKFYPKIRKEDINTPSAKKFVDVMQLSNLYLDGMGGDYDGDTVIVKGSFMNETNKELEKFTDSKANFINLGCNNIRTSHHESVQSQYNLTLILSSDTSKLTAPTF
jgi:hypothetical protein